MADPTSSEVAAEFGYSVAFFNSNPELKKLLGTATKERYSAARFVAALQNTKWFRTQSETYRKYVALKSTDPATWSQQLAQTTVHVLTLGSQMGAILTKGEANKLADLAMRVGMTDEQLRRHLESRLDKNGAGQFYGQAGAAQAQMRKMADDYGITLPSKTLNGMVREIVAGRSDVESMVGRFQTWALSKYPALKGRILEGETVRDIVEPYLQSYGEVLEISPDQVSMKDPLVQRALQSKDKDGKPTIQTLYDFENVLRQDKRWAKTRNAQETMTSTTNAILKTFGLAG